jgi:polar amino acid transport system substrate-binding protein
MGFPLRRDLTGSLTAAVLLALLPAGCGPGADSALERAREQGLRAGFTIEPPYAFVDSAGRVTGEAPEILRVGAAELGIRIDWVPLEFPELIPWLAAGRIDVIASGMFITPERSRHVRFSPPTACAGPVIVVRADGSPFEPGAAGRADCPGCRIAVLQGSVEEAALRGADPGAGRVLVVPDVGTAVAAVRAGSAEAFAISGPTGRELVRHEPGLVARANPFPADVARAASGCAAFGFRPGDDDLAAAFDRVLHAFVGSSAHVRLVRGLGFTREEVPCPSDSAGTAAGAEDCSPVPRRDGGR